MQESPTMGNDLLPADFSIVDQPQAINDLAWQVAQRVFRVDTTKPGFALVDFGSAGEPRTYRRLLVEMGLGLRRAYAQQYSGRLGFIWVGRFDQQTTTRPHRDGAPAGSVLMLGYEPSAVPAQLALVDYARLAGERGLSPSEWLGRYNPMYHPAIVPELTPYTTPVAGFDHRRFQVLVINNGTASLDDRSSGMIGLLHQATVPSPDLSQPRHVNSLMLARLGHDETAGLLSEQLQRYIEQAMAASSC